MFLTVIKRQDVIKFIRSNKQPQQKKKVVLDKVVKDKVQMLKLEKMMMLKKKVALPLVNNITMMEERQMMKDVKLSLK